MKDYWFDRPILGGGQDHGLVSGMMIQLSTMTAKMSYARTALLTFDQELGLVSGRLMLWCGASRDEGDIVVETNMTSRAKVVGPTETSKGDALIWKLKRQSYS